MYCCKPEDSPYVECEAKVKVHLVDLSAQAGSAAAFFMQERSRDRLPFVHSFPANSCEITSYLLAVVLAEKYGDSVVKLVAGYNRARNEWHFWIELEGVVVDITAAQFPGFFGELVCQRPSPFEKIYTEIERQSPGLACDRFPAVRMSVQRAVVSDLARAIAV
jgi:hypothetical protein